MGMAAGGSHRPQGQEVAAHGGGLFYGFQRNKARAKRAGFLGKVC